MTMPQIAGSTAGHFTGQPSVAFQRPTVADRFERLTTAIDTLEGVLGQLRERLEPITGESTPEPGKLAAMAAEGAQGSPADSWLSGRLSEETQRVLSLAASIEGLTRRVDL
jgi:hypothetical protein